MNKIQKQATPQSSHQAGPKPDHQRVDSRIPLLILDSILLGVALAATTLQVAAWLSYRVLGIPPADGSGGVAVATALVLICVRHVFGGGLWLSARWGTVLGPEFEKGVRPSVNLSPESPAPRAALPIQALLRFGKCNPAAASTPGLEEKANDSSRGELSLAKAERASRSLPKVKIAAALLSKICAYVDEFLEKYGQENEAGGMLVGRYIRTAAGELDSILVTGFIPAGPEADFSAGSIQFDAQFQSAWLRCLQLSDMEQRCVGCIHLHPGAFDRPSTGDLATDREALRVSGAPMLVAGIITRVDTGDKGVPGKKLDFFLLGEATGLKYRNISPDIEEMDLTRDIPEGLIDYARIRGASLTYDFRALKNLPGIESIQLRSSDGLKVLTAIEVRDEFVHATVRLIANSSGALDCIVCRDGDKPVSLRGLWTEPETAHHVWLCQVILQVRHQLNAMTERGGLGFKRHHATWWERDPRRLALECLSMKETYGDRAILHQEGATLFWKATSHQSGRTLNVKIVYPNEYPLLPPLIVSEEPLPSSPHSAANSKTFCWHGPQSQWNPHRDCAAVALTTSYRWYCAMLIWVTLGRWPAMADHP